MLTCNDLEMTRKRDHEICRASKCRKLAEYWAFAVQEASKDQRKIIKNRFVDLEKFVEGGLRAFGLCQAHSFMEKERMKADCKDRQSLTEIHRDFCLTTQFRSVLISSVLC